MLDGMYNGACFDLLSVLYQLLETTSWATIYSPHLASPRREIKKADQSISKGTIFLRLRLHLHGQFVTSCMTLVFTSATYTRSRLSIMSNVLLFSPKHVYSKPSMSLWRFRSFRIHECPSLYRVLISIRGPSFCRWNNVSLPLVFIKVRKCSSYRSMGL